MIQEWGGGGEENQNVSSTGSERARFRISGDVTLTPAKGREGGNGGEALFMGTSG